MSEHDAPTQRERPAAAPADLGATQPPTDETAATTAPKMVGRFEIDSELGAGGMGVVYLAFDPTLDRRVAVKLLREDVSADAANQRAQARLAREGRAMARLQHPNVVTVYEVGIHDGHVFIVMEYVPGGTLRSWLAQRHAGKQLSWQRILAVFTSAARGLAAAHAAGLVHRDFKPDNVLLDFSVEEASGPERVLVSDFGIANVYGDDLTSSGPGEPPRQLAATRTGATVGTPLYMSPEQHLGRAVDARTDQFSFCAALYEALYGVAPFGNEDVATIAVNAIDGVLASPPSDHEVPAYVHAAIVRGLRPAPGDRFPTISALLAALAPPAPRRWPRYALAGGAALAVATPIALLAMRSPEAAPVKRAKPTCDCELITATAPPGGRVTGIRAAGGGPSHMPDLGPDDELVVPRGHYLIEYTVDRPYVYGVVSAGMGAARALALPVPELAAGWRFVPGGAVLIGEASSIAHDERPPAVVHLEPYLVQVDESEPITYALALQRAREAGARIPTAAEWEWAARNGAGDHMLSRTWEWTSTVYAAYPYADDGRDDPLAKTPTVEVRGGQTRMCNEDGTLRDPCPEDDDDKDRPRPSRRIAGVRTARAELRMVRAPKYAQPAKELLLHARHDEDGVLTKKEIAALGRFVFEARDRALEFVVHSSLGCKMKMHLESIGMDMRRIAEITNGPEDEIRVRWHPDPAFLNQGLGRCVVTDSEIDILDIICFENERVRAKSVPMIDAIAATLKGNEDIMSVEIAAHVDPSYAGDPLERSQRRADLIRNMLIERGVAAVRLQAQGYGTTRPLPTIPAADLEKRALLGQSEIRCPGAPNDHIGTLILKRRTD
jgi:hypothetical protein